MLVLAVATLVALALGGKWAAEKAVRSSVTSRFEDAEYVVRTHKAPQAWVRKAQRQRRFGILRCPLDEAETRELLVGSIDDLVGYFENSRFVADDETREHLMTELGNVRHQWQEEELSRIITT